MKHGQKIVFSGESDEAPDVTAGDIIVVLSEKAHETFKRQDKNLHMDVKLALVEAICGFTISIKHLDGRKLIVKSSPGDIIQHGEVRAIQGEGMPTYKQPFDKGDLFLHFSITIPLKSDFSAKALKELELVLPKPNRPPVVEDENSETVTLSAPLNIASSSQEGNSRTTSQGSAPPQREAYNEDAGEGVPHGPRQVQCAQQ